jgi:hypothetical protein
MIDVTITRRIELARYLYHLAEENLRSTSKVSACAGINLLHDSTEVYLLAIADHVNAEIKAKTRFEQYIDLVNEQIRPKELPYRSKLLRLNKLRVDSKHHGQFPDENECKEIIISIRRFFDDTASNILSVNFATISLIDHLNESETKELLSSAQAEFSREKYKNCLTTCRKAIFVEIEKRYDISAFQDPEFESKNFFLATVCPAPSYAKSKKYIDENVTDPTDFIVLDHDAIDRDLMKSGISTTAFWNVWRLTPEVYRAKDGKEWAVKYDLHKLDGDLKELAEYVLPTTIEIVLALDRARKANKLARYDNFYIVKLKNEKVTLYKKADKTGAVAGVTPEGLYELVANFYVSGFNDRGPYWRVSNMNFGDEHFIWGFVHDDDVESLREIPRPDGK